MFTFAIIKFDKMQLIHRNLLIGIHDALQETFFEERKFADKVIERLLKKNRKWGSQDRAIVSDIFYNIIRWKKRLEFYLDEPAKPKNTYGIILSYLIWSNTKYKDFEEFRGLSVGKIIKRTKYKIFPSKAIEHSIPEWLEETLSKELGKNWEKEIIALNQQAPTILRANRLKTNPGDLMELLREEGVDCFGLKNYPDAVQLEEKKNVFLSSVFKEGWFEVQDASSQKIAYALDVQPKMRVVDVCAGAGGKTLHLAALMENKGQIIAMDIHDWKLKELKRRAKRAGAHNVETRAISDSKTVKRLYGKADRLLIDAPCSGLGVLKRNPDSKWKIDQDFINRIKNEQAEILQNYAKILKSGGKMIYATCSILPSENQEQVQNFLKNNPDFEFVTDEKVMPSDGYDGFYLAIIQRK